ncbi:MAG: 16S rRNA (guanine(966)-N(2))-methyltransferase RsmD [Chloroflexota bacterium]
MRVTGGAARGQPLKAPKSRLTRPTTDMVRSAMFSLLAGVTDWSRVLDLFAGSGALGIEALSRGAGWADFVDQQPQACAIIKDNLRKTGLAERAHVYCAGVNSALSFLKGHYNVVFMDPPYAQSQVIITVLKQLAGSTLLAEGSCVAVCHASRSPLETGINGLAILKQRRYGDTTVTILRKETRT